MQGPVHFDGNGIRDITELRVLQYRTTYINGTPISGEGGLITPNGTRLKLIDVAYMSKDNRSLEFLEGDRNSIWPGK